MPTLAPQDSDLNVNLWKERRRMERPEPFQAVSDSTRWTARCMHVGCKWAVGGLLSEQAARTGGELHYDVTGHPVKLRAVVEFDCGVIRAEGGVR